MKSSPFRQLQLIVRLKNYPYTIITVLLILCSYNIITFLFYTDHQTFHKPKNIPPESQTEQFFIVKHAPHHIRLADRKEVKESDLELVEQASNIAGRFYEEFNSTDFKARPQLPNVTYCDNVVLTDPADLSYNNEFWQVYHINSTLTIYLYSAFFDDRYDEHYKVRIILATFNQAAVENTTFKCLLWYDGHRSPVLTDGSPRKLWPDYFDWEGFSRTGTLGPFLLSCTIPRPYQEVAPRAVSVQYGDDCESMQQFPSNVLRIENHTKRPRKLNESISIGVCVKGHRFSKEGDNKLSKRTIEWLEMMKILQADKVYLYHYGLPEMMKGILKTYQREEFVESRRVTYPGELPNIDFFYKFLYTRMDDRLWPEEMMELNDCLYRNMAKHDYIAVIDLDELIVPVKDYSWKDMLLRLEERFREKNSEFDYISNDHIYVLMEYKETKYVDQHSWDRIPDWLHFMQHIKVSDPREHRDSPKSFSMTQNVMIVHNHHATSCWNEHKKQEFNVCSCHPLSSNTSRMLHFREHRFIESNKTCGELTPDYCVREDKVMWKYYWQLKTAVKLMLKRFYQYEEMAYNWG